MKKKIFLSIIFIFLLILLVYVTNITSMPESIVLFKNEKLSLKIVPGITLKEKSDNNSYSKKIQNNEAIEATARNFK